VDIELEGCGVEFTESISIKNVVDGTPVERLTDLEDLIQVEWDARGQPSGSSSGFADSLLHQEP
jgi:hypothetical protein